MKKITSPLFVTFVALAACAHESAVHKDVGEEKLEFAPDPPAPTASAEEEPDAPPDTAVVVDAGAYPFPGSYESVVAASIADGTKKPDPPNVYANGHRAVLSDKRIKNFWQVPMDLAKSADALLEAYLRTTHPKVADNLAHYDAQIWGETEKGKKMIVFYLMNRNAIRIGADGSQNSDDWMKEHAQVSDGFEDFFAVYFDADKGCF